MINIFTPVVYQLGLGAVGGFIIGFLAKKISKIILVLMGLFIVTLVYLGFSKVLNINYGALLNAAVKLFGMVGIAGSVLGGFLSLLPFFATFAAGFVLALKIS
jgi:uncharacterized membrane protein (Fun14 family)